MSLNALNRYEFRGFKGDLEHLNETHPHRVRRESGLTYVDEFAQRKIINNHQELYDQAIKGWSRSYYDPNKHMEQILNYAIPDIPLSAIDEQLYNECCMAVANGFHGLPTARAFNVLTELDRVAYKSSTAAGYDYNGEKGPYRGTNHMKAISRARAIVGDVYDRGVSGMDHAIRTMVPDVGYTRTQLTNLAEKMKVRSVWGRAFHYILIEGVTADPLVRLFSSNKTFYHIGRDPLDSVPDVLSEAVRKGKWLYAIDWRQFDATVSRFELESAFEILKKLIEFPNEHTAIAFLISKELYIHKKLAAPDGYVYWVHKGIPSGSYFTSIIGSIVNRIRIEYLWRKILGRGPRCCYTQGDDSISSDDEFIPPETFARVANPIGWVINPEKTEYSTIPSDVSFLGRTMIGGLNTRNLLRCIRLLVYPEYPVESGRISAYRARSIADDAGGLSAILNRIADELKAEYGVASEDEVPSYFKRYVLTL